MFDFDRIIERRGTHSSKWDSIARLSGIESPDAIAMWVADMDFAAPPGVTSALTAEIQCAVHGYYADTGSWAAALADWMARRHGLRIDPRWVSPTPGIVSGLGLILQAVSTPGDEVVVFPPAYHAFRGIIVANERRILDAQLVETDGRYAMDLDALRAKLTPRTKVVFLCSPHNPGGTVWSPSELRALAALCVEHDLILVSDEIHCDLLLEPGAVHEPVGVVAPGESSRTLTFMAPSKTYNVPGLGASFAIIPDAALRARYVKATAGIVAEVNVFGYVACEAAYRDSEPWRQALLDYLRGNRDYLEKFVRDELPGVRIEAPIEATYLAWLNVADLGLAQPARHYESAGVGLSDGVPFCAAPGTHVRINFGCPRSTLAEGLARMKRAAPAR